MTLRSFILDKLDAVPRSDLHESITDEELNSRLEVLHRDGDLAEAADLLRKFRPWDVCDNCGGTGQDTSDMVWTYAGPQYGVCDQCDGTGSKSKRPVWTRR